MKILSYILLAIGIGLIVYTITLQSSVSSETASHQKHLADEEAAMKAMKSPGGDKKSQQQELEKIQRYVGYSKKNMDDATGDRNIFGGAGLGALIFGGVFFVFQRKKAA